MDPSESKCESNAEAGAAEQDESDVQTSLSASFMREAKEIKQLFDNFGNDQDSHNKIAAILQKYQEMPELLDPHLESFVTPLMALVRQHISTAAKPESAATIHRCFKIVYVLCKVRGYKTVVKLFPHEVSDLEPTFELLLAQSSTDFDTWETRYSLLLWMSIICIIPFDLTTVDSSVGAHTPAPIPASAPKPHTAPIHPALSAPGAASAVAVAASVDTQPIGIIAKLIHTGKMYLRDTGAARDMAAVMLARLLSRPDMHASHLSEFLNWTVETLAKERNNVFLVTGIFSALCHIFRHAPRAALLDKMETIYTNVVKNEAWTTTQSGLLRKLVVKLAQRVGLTYLKPVVASWRYQRGHRSLMQTLSSSANTAGGAGSSVADDSAEQADVPGELEEIIQRLLDGLRDRDTVVRWSAAKGVGRITMRLPSDFADEVVGSVLDLFSVTESDGAWHGGCLALAELARRGLLLPVRLPTVIPVTLKALNYDIRRGAFSVGSHVRDAACYVCWAFARAYAPTVMAPYVADLARGLLTVAVFDREINCRRAAAAAFQENVGRQGNFPHGIEINTCADYFTLGNRGNAYLNISVSVAAFQEYTTHLIDHLLQVKTKHWDKPIRELAAQSLGKLVPLAPQYLRESGLQTLLPQTLSKDLFERHGALLSIAEIVLALHKAGHSPPPQVSTNITAIIPKLEAANLLGGKGGALMRAGVLRLIECQALAQWPLPADEQEAKKYLLAQHAVLDDNLAHPEDEIQQQAAAAVKAFAAQYRYAYKSSEQGSGAAGELWSQIAQKWLKTLRAEDPSPYARRGVALAVGALPELLLLDPKQPGLYADFVFALIECTKIAASSDLRDAETRRNAVSSLAAVCVTLGESVTAKCLSPAWTLNPRIMTDSEAKSTKPKAGLPSRPVAPAKPVAESKGEPPVPSTVFHASFHTMIAALEDYSTDNRGDVGSWVREASLVGLEKLVSTVVSKWHQSPSQLNALWNAGFAAKLFCGILKQMMEKINRVREVAGGVFVRILTHAPEVPSIPHYTQLRNLITSANAANNGVVDWSNPSVTFPLLMPLLSLADYRAPLLAGLVVSVGGLTESLVRHAGDALVAYLNDESRSPEEMHAVLSTLLTHLTAYRLAGRVLIPTFKTIDLLFVSRCFEKIESAPQFEEQLLQLHALAVRDLAKTEDFAKIAAITRVLLGLLSFQFPAVRTKSIDSTLQFLLLHRFPKVRRSTAEEMYTCLIAADNLVSDENLDEVLVILQDTPWDSPTDTIAAKRDALYPLFGLEVPTSLPTAATAGAGANTDNAVASLIAQRDKGGSYQDFIDSLK